MAEAIKAKYPDPSEEYALGIGTTLTGSAVAARAIKATLQQVLTEDAYNHMHEMADRYAEGVQSVIDEYELPWRVVKMGSRIEYLFNQDCPVNGTDVYESFHDFELHTYIHLAMSNRGILITPFHNMALMCPDTKPEQVDMHTEMFRQVIGAVVD